MKIEIYTVGKILSGDCRGDYVKILDDVKISGGFLILTSKHIDMKDSYDNWVESENYLYLFFKENSWEVDWEITQ